MRSLAVLFTALLLLGCPGKGQNENPITPPAKEMPSQRTPLAATTPIEVQLTEYQIQMPDTVSAGVHTFHIANAGKETHSFAIEGNGVSEKLGLGNLPRGDTTNLSIDLKPGTYTIFCPVDGHRGKGMQRTLTVNP